MRRKAPPASGCAFPSIKGNARQEIKLHWGKADAASESNGSAVFNADNGYATVLHMDEALKDEVGTITPKDAGSTVAAGMIGKGRHFVAGKGINGGDHITNYPFSDNPFTSEAWFRAEAAGTVDLRLGAVCHAVQRQYRGRQRSGDLRWVPAAALAGVPMVRAAPPPARRRCWASGITWPPRIPTGPAGSM